MTRPNKVTLLAWSIEVKLLMELKPPCFGRVACPRGDGERNQRWGIARGRGGLRLTSPVLKIISEVLKGKAPPSPASSAESSIIQGWWWKKPAAKQRVWTRWLTPYQPKLE